MVSYANTPDKKTNRGNGTRPFPLKISYLTARFSAFFLRVHSGARARNPGPCRAYTRHFAFGETEQAGHTPVLGFCFACVPVAFGWLFWFHLA